MQSWYWFDGGGLVSLVIQGPVYRADNSERRQNRLRYILDRASTFELIGHWMIRVSKLQVCGG